MLCPIKSSYDINKLKEVKTLQDGYDNIKIIFSTSKIQKATHLNIYTIFIKMGYQIKEAYEKTLETGLKNDYTKK